MAKNEVDKCGETLHSICVDDLSFLMQYTDKKRKRNNSDVDSELGVEEGAEEAKSTGAENKTHGGKGSA